MAYLSEGSKVGGKQIETVDGAQAKANQARDSAVDTVLRWAKDLGLGTTAKAIQNWDELEQTGFYNGNNGPLGNSIVFGIHVQHSSNYGLQVVGRHNRLFIRTRENDIWNHWRELESVDKVESKLNELKNELTSLVDDTKKQLQSNLDSHVNNKSNPHNVTKSQIGLGSVQNYGIASQSEAEAGTANNKYMTPLRTKQLVDKFAETPAGAQAKVNALKNNEVEPLKTRVSNAEKSINQISNEVSSKVSRTEFESLQIGGRNLIKDSNNFTNYVRYGGVNVTFTTGVSVPEWNATDATRIQTSGGTSLAKVYKDVVTPSVAGQQYTLSVWVKNIGSYPVIVNNNLSSGTGRVNPGEQKRVIITGMGNGITNFQIKFQATTDDISNPLDFIVWRAKAELGNRATDWTPAPEDVETYAEQKAQEVIDAVEVGGRNLLRNTSDKNKTVSWDGWDYRLISVPSIEDVGLSVGDTVVFRVYIEETNAPVSAFVEFIQNDGGVTRYRKKEGNIIYEGESGWSEVKFTISEEDVMDLTLFKVAIRNMDNSNATVTYRKAKLEIGNKATDWTPAPEDVEAYAEQKAQEVVDAHANQKDNPHGVTKAQVGLGSVENYGIATQAEAEAGTANNKFMTPYRTKQAIDSLSPVKSVNGKKGSISLAKEDVGIYVQYSKPSNPKVGDLWIW